MLCTHFRVRPRKKTLGAIFFIILLLGSRLALAATGALRVTLTDTDTQHPLPDAEVTAVARDGASRRAQSDHNGQVLFSGLETGLYEVRILRSGYQAARQPSVRIVADKITPLPLKLTDARKTVEEVEVVGTAVSGNLLNSVGTSYIDREALRSAAGSGSDALRALDNLPGLFADGEYSSFTVRGNGPRDNLILVDGIPFDKVVHFSNSFGELEEVEGGGRYSVFAPNTIAGAEFQPGGWSAAYGGRAGSLLKLEVAEGNPDTPSYTARLDIAGLEVGYDGPSPIHDDTTLLLSVRQYDFGRMFDMIGLEDVGSPKLTDFIAKSTTQLSDRDELSLLAISAPEEFSRDIDNVLASDEDDPGSYEDVELTRNKADNSLLAATWSRLLGNDSELVNQLYVRWYDERGSSGEAYPDWVAEGTPAQEIPMRKNILLSKRDEKELGWRLDFSTTNALGRISSGLRATQINLSFDRELTGDWIRYTYDKNDLYSDPEEKYIVLTPEEINNRYTQESVNYALYLDQEIDMEDWIFRVGTRYEHDDLSGEDLIAPRFGATWAPSSKWRVTSTAGRYFQKPHFGDRASDADNAQLENEIIDQLSLGLRYWVSPRIELFVEPYYQKLDKLVVEDDGINQTLVNTGYGESCGVDTGVTRQFENGWSAGFKYSYNRARVRDNATEAYYDADFGRPHSASVGGTWEINQRWKLSTRWKWASGKPRDAFIVHENVLGDGEPLRYAKEITNTNTQRYKNFSSLNVRVDYRRDFGHTNLIAFIDVINLLGSDNPSNSEFNERTGEDVVEEGESLPLFGLRFEW